MADYKVIDWRLRPPFGSFKENKIYEFDPRVPAPEAAKKFSMDLMIKEMDKSGVQIGIVPFRKGQDIGDMEKLTHEYPDRFYCMAHIDPYADDPVKDIDKLIIDGPAKLAIIEPGQYFIKKSIPADDKILYPIYEKCQKENIVLTITFGGLYCDALELYNPIYIDRVAKDFPDLNMVLTHGGWPYVREIMHVCYQHGNVFLSPDFYLSPINPGCQDYALAASGLLQDQIIFGSAYPAQSLQDAINGHFASGLSEETSTKIFWSNAAKLLKIEK